MPAGAEAVSGAGPSVDLSTAMTGEALQPLLATDGFLDKVRHTRPSAPLLLGWAIMAIDHRPFLHCPLSLPCTSCLPAPPTTLNITLLCTSRLPTPCTSHHFAPLAFLHPLTLAQVKGFMPAGEEEGKEVTAADLKGTVQSPQFQQVSSTNGALLFVNQHKWMYA